MLQKSLNILNKSKCRLSYSISRKNSLSLHKQTKIRSIMSKKVYLSVLFIFSALSLFSQIYEPITCKISSVEDGNTVEIKFEAGNCKNSLKTEFRQNCDRIESEFIKVVFHKV